ncbi:hypothetical protein COU54_04695 [Candidatus Pacearchaeota archaeon CG10_big_fil_rev_8_21_14_0_10_31_24]|nr:MAG: hypothetical protein COU54_04695 [Candidatus Pacearchaeota archaeon CG10_big_fil_rev_8_21_14_0_10_31_24]
MQKTSKKALITTLFLLLILTIYFIEQLPLTLNNSSEIENLKNNQIILTQGKIIKEQTFLNKKILTLNNSIILECECPKEESLLNQNITSTAILNTFNKPSLKVLKLTLQNK